MIWFLWWLIAVELLALSALPLAVRLFRRLPDRGYLFAKPLGALVVAYLCWILGTFGMLRFQQATIALALVAVGAAAWVALGRQTLRALSGVRTILLLSEGLFLLFFAAAALIRAYNPEVSGTEKPMDFALLNALYRTESFPAEDPWMSGHSISYYYFGYLLLATIAKLSGVPAAVGYNLGVALVFALLLAGGFSLASNLVSMLMPGMSLPKRLVGALAAPLLIGIMGNLEVGLEVLAVRGFGDAAFWNWVGIKGLSPAADAQGWLPTSHWWWWRASRVIPTIKPDGITEFPYFSFLLGDLHPHYTALPWALLAVALSLSALAGRALGGKELFQDRLGVAVVAVALGFLLVGNSWDFPTYTALFWAASLVPITGSDWSREKLLRRARGLALVAVSSVLLYSPFFLGFSSQTKGIGLSADRTPLPSMLILFGPFLLLLGALLVWWGWGGWTPSFPPEESSTGVKAGPYGEGLRPPREARLLLPVGILLVLSSWFLGTAALLVGLLALAVAAFIRVVSSEGSPDGGEPSTARRFLVILVAGGLLLILVPEFVFLVDLFGTRMNTVFKFHYQAWLLLGLASAIAMVSMAARLRPLAVGGVVVGGAALLVGVGLLYPLAATPDKTQGFQPQPTLDGTAFYQRIRPDDFAAIQWLSRTAVGRPVVLEATGGEYSEYARVATFSGLPTVLGWAGHEVQWRGQGEEPQRRAQDVEAIYRSADPSTMLGLLMKYGVEYVFVGSLEVDRYGPEVAHRFEATMEPIHRQGRVTIYRVPQHARDRASG